MTPVSSAIHSDVEQRRELLRPSGMLRDGRAVLHSSRHSSYLRIEVLVRCERVYFAHDPSGLVQVRFSEQDTRCRQLDVRCGEGS